MNILFVHEVDWLKKVIYEPHTLSELLSLAGHNVYAIDYESMWIRDGTFDFGTLRTTSRDVARTYDGAVVKLIRPGFIKIPVLSRLSAFFTHWRVIKQTIREKNIDVIVLYSAPTNGLQTIALSRELGVPVIFRSIDVLHRLVDNPLLARVTNQIEKIVYSRSDLILTITPALTRYVVNLGTSEDKVRVLPLGVDTDLFRPRVEDRELRSQLGFEDSDKVIVFMGTLPKFSGLDTFIRAFPDLLRTTPDARLLVVGDGVQRPILEVIIDKLGLKKKVIITGFLAHEMIPRFINLASVCINTFPISDTTRDIFPTKVAQYMACGKPVISTPLLGLREMSIGRKQGVVYSSLGAMNMAIASLLSDNTRVQEMGKLALEYARYTHDYSKIVGQLETELSILVRDKIKNRREH